MSGLSENQPLLMALTKKYGTPLYIYDGNRIRDQWNQFIAAFSGVDLHIKYAMKALSNHHVLVYLRELGAGLDTVSVNEIRLGLQAGFSSKSIVYTPNCVTFEEMKEAVGLGVTVNIENISLLRQFGETYGPEVPCFLRLQPNIIDEKDAAADQVWQNQSKFGIALSQLTEACAVIEQYNIQVEGLHIHSSSQVLNTARFLRGAEILFDLAHSHFPNLKVLDFGGGIRVPHRKEEETICLSDLGSVFVQRLQRFFKAYGRPLQLWFEPGRFLVSDSGQLLVTVTTVKSNGSVDIVGVNSGFNHLIRPKLYGAYHHIDNLSNPAGKLQSYMVVGNLCEQDVFALDRRLPEVREGDVLAIRNAGAYGMSMSSNYNGRFRPAEVLIREGQPHLIRRRDTLEDLLRPETELI